MKVITINGVPILPIRNAVLHITFGKPEKHLVSRIEQSKT